MAHPATPLRRATQTKRPRLNRSFHPSLTVILNGASRRLLSSRSLLRTYRLAAGGPRRRPAEVLGAVPQVSCFETWVLPFPFFPPRLSFESAGAGSEKTKPRETTQDQVQKKLNLEHPATTPHPDAFSPRTRPPFSNPSRWHRHSCLCAFPSPQNSTDFTALRHNQASRLGQLGGRPRKSKRAR